ncbi:MAG: SDR family oxidoreductase [Firmicutes bacterium]|nr:SDR family oxidoreductase [Bacillota bacterium]
MRGAAIVTGGASGIGFAIASRLTCAGFPVVIADVDLKAATRAAADLSSGGARVLPVQVDVTSDADARVMVDAAISEFGRLDALVNNAGIYPARAFMEIDDDHWDAIFDINVKGVVRCSQAALRVMIPQRSGRIVNMASADGKRPALGNAGYCASKAAVMSLTRSIALEMAPHGILVNAVAPGWVGTKKVYESDRWKDGLGQIPLRRLGTPEEIGDAVVYLCSEASSYVTGEVLNVNGGFLMD